MKIHAFRLLPGQDLKQEIQAFAHRNNIRAGWIATCVGSLTQVHLRFADQPDGSLFTGHFEIVSLVGTVSIHGCHLHLCISDERGRSTGGHLLEGNSVYTTAEVVMGETGGLEFLREADAETGWKELRVAGTTKRTEGTKAADY